MLKKHIYCLQKLEVDACLSRKQSSSDGARGSAHQKPPNHSIQINTQARAGHVTRTGRQPNINKRKRRRRRDGSAGRPGRSLHPVVSEEQGLLFDVLGGAALVQVQQDLQQLVQAGAPALLLHPHVQQLVEAVLVRKLLPAFDHVVVDVEAAEELAVVVDVQLLEELEAAPQRLLACGRRSRRPSPPPWVEADRRFLP